MVKGRNSTVVCVRIPDTVYAIMQRRASKRKISVSDWLKVAIRHQKIGGL